MDTPKKKVLVLDLEETIIHRFPWSSKDKIRFLEEKIQFIHGFREKHPWEEIWILSFAIFNEVEIGLFDRWLKDDVETLFSSKVKRHVSMSMIARKIARIHCHHIDPNEVGIFGKDVALQQFVVDETDLDLLFFDDTIENTEFVNKDRNIRIVGQKI